MARAVAGDYRALLPPCTPCTPSPCHQSANIAIFLSARLLFPAIIACHVNFTLFTFLDTHQAKMWQGLEFLTFPLVTNSADSIQLEGS